MRDIGSSPVTISVTLFQSDQNNPFPFTKTEFCPWILTVQTNFASLALGNVELFSRFPGFVRSSNALTTAMKYDCGTNV